MPKTAHKPPEQDIETRLTAIYQDEGGEIPDMTKLEPAKSRWRQYAAFVSAGFVICLVAAAWLGFSFFKPFRGFTGQGLSLTIEGPEKVALGEETRYSIVYANQTAEPISDAELRVSFPSDFVVRAVEPSAGKTQMVWDLGSLPVKGEGAITVYGTFTGALGTVTAVQVVGNYRPASFASDFEALATKVLRYETSVLDGSLTVPVKVLPGDNVALAYNVQNNGTAPFESLEARFTLPEGFQPETPATKHVIEGRSVRIPLPAIPANASTTVTVRGTFGAGVSGEAHVVAESGRMSRDGVFLSSQRTATSFTVLAGDLSLKLVVNGTDADTTITYGAPLHIGMSYENTASEDLRDVVLRLRIESATGTGAKVTTFVDWASFDGASNGTRKGNVATWNAEHIPALKRLPPHEEAFLNVALAGLAAKAGSENLAFKLTFEAEVGSVGNTKVKRVVKATPIILRYLTDASITSVARFYSEEGAPLGSGPLPPKVGEPTTYRIQWTVAKNFHELKNVKITATLPKIASWADKAISESGKISYDEKTRTVTWSLNRMPADVDEQAVGFDVTITPTEADANRFAQLLGETRFEATDTNMDKTILLTQPALTTDLEFDDGAQGKGVVRKP